MRGKVEGNTIAFGDVKYRAVVLPSVQYIMPNTMKKLDEFARNGGIVIAVGAAPRMAPGYLSTDADQQVVRDVGRRLFAAAQPTGKLIQNASELGAALTAKGLAPDMTLEPANADIGFVHRHTADAEIYFVANTTNQTQSAKARFRVSGKNAEVWDPMNGKVTRPAGTNLSSVDLELEPYGSRIVVFSNRSLPAAGAVVSAGSGAAIDLSANWTVKFGSSGPTVEMAALRSWTDDEATRAFSGRGNVQPELQRRRRRTGARREMVPEPRPGRRRGWRWRARRKWVPHQSRVPRP